MQSTPYADQSVAPLDCLMYTSKVSPESVLSCSLRFIEVMRASFVNLYRPRNMWLVKSRSRRRIALLYQH